MSKMHVVTENVDDLESLLRERNLFLEEKKKKKDATKSKYSKAEKGASFDDFIGMVREIVAKTMTKDNVEFIPDEGSTSPMNPLSKLGHPIIYYNLVSREPRKTEPKPKIREAIVEKDESGRNVRVGDIYGQIFDAEIQFNILASDYSIANKVMNTFEDAMFTYSGYFKQHGLSEIFFVKQYTDESLMAYRQKMAVRSLVYRVTFERIWLNYDAVITEINQQNEEYGGISE